MIRRAAIIVLLAMIVPVLPAARAAEPTADSRLELVGVNGFSRLVRLVPGDTGDDVAHLQQSLADAGFYHSEVDGEYGRTTASAVVAFHKYLGLERTDTFGALDWIRLGLLPDPGLPERWDEPDRIEVDLERQLLFLVRAGEPVQILPVSTGGGYTYVSARTGRSATASTPKGDFVLKWHQRTWVCDDATGWCVYKYWAFTDYYGIHGYRNVPTYPASHGCVRIEVWDADWIEPHLYVGMPLHIWNQPPVIPPPPPAQPPAEAPATAL